jgi:hypothetical protein
LACQSLGGGAAGSSAEHRAAAGSPIGPQRRIACPARPPVCGPQQRRWTKTSGQNLRSKTVVWVPCGRLRNSEDHSIDRTPGAKPKKFRHVSGAFCWNRSFVASARMSWKGSSRRAAEQHGATEPLGQGQRCRRPKAAVHHRWHAATRLSANRPFVLTAALFQSCNVADADFAAVRFGCSDLARSRGMAYAEGGEPTNPSVALHLQQLAKVAKLQAPFD